MTRIATRTLAQMLHRVGTSLHAGVDVLRTWQQEASRGSPRHQTSAQRVVDGIAGGDSLAEAMSAVEGYFPPLTCELIDVGEQTGQLEAVMLGLAEHYDHLLDLRRTFLMGIAWPAIQLGAAILIIGLLIWVMGLIGSGAGGEPIDILGFGLVGTSGMLLYFFLVASVFGLFALGLLSLMRGWLGPRPLQLAMRVPVIGGSLQTASLSRMAWTFSLTLNAGMDARRSIALAIRSTQNPYYTASLEQVDTAVSQGCEFHEALRETGCFPDEFLDSLQAAELAGTQTESLERLAKDYRERARTSAKALTVAASFGVWAMVALILVLLIMRLAMFYIGTIYSALEGI